MPDSLQIGPVMMDGQVLAYLIAAAAGFIALTFRLRQAGQPKHLLTDVMFSGIVIVILFWRFGSILTQPRLIIDNPKLLLMMAGSSWEVTIGAGVALLYAVFRLKRGQVPLLFSADLLAYGALAFVAMKQLLTRSYGIATSLPWGMSPAGVVQKYHPLGLYTGLLLGILLLWISIRPVASGTGRDTTIIMMGIGVITFAVSMLHPPQTVFVFLTSTQWVALSLLVIGYLWSISGIIKQEGRDEHES